jgi:hypothetical protein
VKGEQGPSWQFEDRPGFAAKRAFMHSHPRPAMLAPVRFNLPHRKLGLCNQVISQRLLHRRYQRHSDSWGHFYFTFTVKEQATFRLPRICPSSSLTTATGSPFSFSVTVKERAGNTSAAQALYCGGHGGD